MIPSAVLRARALAMLAAVLREEPDAPLPGDAGGWGAFLDLAAEHALLPAVYVALRPSGRVDVPAPVARALELAVPAGRAVPEVVLRRAYDHNVARVARLFDAGVELLHAFAAEKVRAVPLKGLHSLLAGTWPDPAARTMVDLDVLVEAGRAEQAYARLLGAGYEEHPDPIGEHADHHLPMLRRDDVTMELHTELLVSRWRALAPAHDVLERAMFRPTPGGTLLLADDVDSFVHLVAHAQLQEETYTLLGLPLRASTRPRATSSTRRTLPPPASGSSGPASRTCSTPISTPPADCSVPPHRRTTRSDVRRRTPGWRRSGWRHLRSRRAGRTRCASRGRSAPSGWPRNSAPAEGAEWLWRARTRHAGRRVAVRVRRRGR